MHKHRKREITAACRGFLPAKELDARFLAHVFLVVFALCLVILCQYPDHNSTEVFLFFLIVSFFSGLVIVSGDTVMAAQNLVFFKKKIEKLQDNINQLQLAGGHFPGAILPNQPSSPFLVLLWFPSGNPLPGLPVFCCPEIITQSWLKKVMTSSLSPASKERR